MKDAEIERSNKLLSLSLTIRKAVLLKIWRLLSPTISVSGCGDHQTVWSGSRGSGVGVDERNKIVRKLCQRIAEKMRNAAIS